MIDRLGANTPSHTGGVSGLVAARAGETGFDIDMGDGAGIRLSLAASGGAKLDAISGLLAQIREILEGVDASEAGLPTAGPLRWRY